MSETTMFIENQDIQFVKAYVGGMSDSGHSALLDSNGHLWLAGCDRWQQLGLGSSSAGSAGYTWNQGRIWRTAFVRNGFLATALPQVTISTTNPTPTTTGNSGRLIRDVALGGDHTVVLSSNQKDVYVFGKGAEGQLGVDGKPFVSAPTRSKVLSSSDDKPDIAAVCAIKNCSLTLNQQGGVLSKAGKCRGIEKSLVKCIRRAEFHGLLAKTKNATADI